MPHGKRRTANGKWCVQGEKIIFMVRHSYNQNKLQYKQTTQTTTQTTLQTLGCIFEQKQKQKNDRI